MNEKGDNTIKDVERIIGIDEDGQLYLSDARTVESIFSKTTIIVPYIRAKDLTGSGVMDFYIMYPTLAPVAALSSGRGCHRDR